MARREYDKSIIPPNRKIVYESCVHPSQRIFKDNQNFLIVHKGITYKEFNRRLKEQTGIIMCHAALRFYRSKGSNNMYYFCSVAYLLNINVLDLFRTDFIEQYLAGNIKDVIYPQPEPIDTIQK